jgi:hypothetical protein
VARREIVARLRQVTQQDSGAGIMSKGEFEVPEGSTLVLAEDGAPGFSASIGTRLRSSRRSFRSFGRQCIMPMCNRACSFRPVIVSGRHIHSRAVRPLATVG